MLRRLLIAAFAFSLLGGAIGCYGKFAVTKKLHAWNGTVGGKFVNSIVFWALVIIPVYEVLAVGDTLIFNVIEFWTGSNPIAEGGATMMADGTVVFERDGERFELVPVGPDRVELRVDGEVIGEAERTAEGDLAVVNHRDGTAAVISREELAAV
ncbi:MAG: DUF3332 family protein, partial [Myxococcales bacterium]|nr:DUF3332 family protein [Myxococcales bacterium]